MIHAICHHGQTLINGILLEITETGCDLKSFSTSSGPDFALKTQVILNLFNEKTGQSMNTQARLIGYIRRDSVWIYRVRWRSCPEICKL